MALVEIVLEKNVPKSESELTPAIYVYSDPQEVKKKKEGNKTIFSEEVSLGADTAYHSIKDILTKEGIEGYRDSYKSDGRRFIGRIDASLENSSKTELKYLKLRIKTALNLN